MNISVNKRKVSPSRLRKLFIVLSLVLFVLSSQTFTSCKRFVDVGTPPDRISQENVYSNDQTAISVLTGLYVNYAGSSADMAKYCGLLSDELGLWSGADLLHQAYYTNTLVSNPTITYGNQIWNQYYNLIFNCNSAISGLNNSVSLRPNVKKQLLGEAYFLRSWLYFYMVNLYGDLPLAVSIDPEINRLLSRSTINMVYELIIQDLLKAQELLSSAYVDGRINPYSSNTQRIRPTKWAAAALLAKVYLYKGEWTKAEIESTKVIDNTALFDLLSDLNGVFLKNSGEAIWQIQPTDLNYNTRDGMMFNLAEAPSGLSGSKLVYLTTYLLNAFEANDNRRNQWVSNLTSGAVTYYFPTKYKLGASNPNIVGPENLSEYSMMLRLGEQYLIRAEAKARQNNKTSAIADLDKIRKRAGLSLIANTNPGISQDALLTAILHERQVELFTEWGNRWFDLKRSGQVDEVMQVVTPVKGGNWENTDQLLPIPHNDLLYGSNLNQNAGY